MSSYLDAITALGTGSLHPGGFFHTLQVLRQVSLSTEDIVLDIGCGTGRTACHIAKNSGAHVFALDNSAEMLRKAKYRAAQEGAQVQFVQCDAQDTPFLNAVFDLIIIESVLIFLPAARVLRECRRIAKKKGLLLSVEMYADKSIPPHAREQFQAACNLPHIPSFEEWLALWRQAGFTPVSLRRSVFPNVLDNIRNLLYPDPYQIISRETVSSHEVSQVMQKFHGLLQTYRNYLGYGTFLMQKQ